MLDDDGADRGLCFVFVGAHLDRQFEFVQAQWVQRRARVRRPAEKDPLVGPNDGAGAFTIPARPIRRRLTDLPRFVSTRGGEYCFAPSLTGLRWLAELDGLTVQHSAEKGHSEKDTRDPEMSMSQTPTPPPSSPAGARATASCPR